MAISFSTHELDSPKKLSQVWQAHQLRATLCFFYSVPILLNSYTLVYSKRAEVSRQRKFFGTSGTTTAGRILDNGWLPDLPKPRETKELYL